MNDVQINRLNSLVKSDDFLNDNAVAVSVITQIPPLTEALKTKIQEINSAGAKGALDLRGVAEDKGNRRKKLKAQMMKVARGAAAYYQSASKTKELRIVDYNNSELDSMRDMQLYGAAKETHAMATADVANLINVVQADLDELDTDKEAFFAVIQDPKREIEITKVQNAQIDPLINEGADMRKQIDIYMQTLIADTPALYAEWKATLSIDDTGASNPPVFTANQIIEAGGIQAIDYRDVAIKNNMEIKLINLSAGALDYGFGGDSENFAITPITVNAESNKRKTAVGLGYNAAEFTSLNVRNNAGEPLECTLEFYEM